MKYAGIIKNDIAAGEGINVSFFMQGCPIHCEGCHNKELWDFNGGKEFTENTLIELIKALNENGIYRNFSLMGGEPLCKENLHLSLNLIGIIRTIFPDIKIYVWTGYTYEQLMSRDDKEQIQSLLSMCDYLIDGPFILKQRDITLPMRGSRNQRIIDLKEKNKI